MATKDLYSGLIRLHILHHAVQGPIFGLGIMEELGKHGYKVSLCHPRASSPQMSVSLSFG